MMIFTRWSCCLIRGELWPGCCGERHRNPVGEFWVILIALVRMIDVSI